MATLKYWGKQVDETYAWIPVNTVFAILDNTITNDKLVSDIKIGSLALLNTTAKTNVVDALNSVNTNIGDLTTLQTNIKTNVVGAINDLKSQIGTGTAINITNGSGTFGGNAGRIIAHITTPDTSYKVLITPTGEIDGTIGEITVTDKTRTSFTVKNTGSNITNSFDWIIIQ